MNNHRFLYLSLLVVALGIASVQLFAYLDLLRPSSPTTSLGGTVNVLISYSNGTLNWYNSTSIGSDGNFWDLTLNLTKGNVDATFYGPPLNEHFVTGINHIINHNPYYWTLWTFCQKQNAWGQSPVGADLLQLTNGEIYSWAYEIPYRSPVPGMGAIGACS